MDLAQDARRLAPLTIATDNRVGADTTHVFTLSVPAWSRGDASGDGAANVADVLYLINYWFVG